MAVECMDCCEVIFDIDNGYIDEGDGGLTDEEIALLWEANKDVKHSSDYNGVNPHGVTVVGYPER
jgi:hypothetical protein